jgi:hypothetical protein
MVMPILIIAERTLSGVRHEPAQADNSNAAIRIALAISPAGFPIDPPEAPRCQDDEDRYRYGSCRSGSAVPAAAKPVQERCRFNVVSRSPAHFRARRHSMNISTILGAIGMIAATVGAAGTADAQRRDHDRDRGRYEQRDHRDYRDHRGPRFGRHDRGPRFERDRHDRCRTVIRHNRRVRVCR